MEQTQSTRRLWIDTLKAAAIFIVFFTHFIARFHTEYFFLWNTPPSSFILQGVTGKSCVALLGVITGYFAYQTREKSITVYVLKRWFFFFFSGLIINTIRVIAGEAGLMKPVLADCSIIQKAGRILTESIRIGDGIYATFWCMFPFFSASVFSCLNRKAGAPYPVIIVQIAILVSIRQVWVAVCMLGALIGCLEQNKRFKRVCSWIPVQIAFAAISFFVVKRPESETTYFLDGLISAGLVLIIGHNTALQRILSNRYIASVGKRVIAVFLIHVVMYNLVGGFVIERTAWMPYRFSFLTAMAASWISILLVSRPLLAVINQATETVAGLLRKGRAHISEKEE